MNKLRKFLVIGVMAITVLATMGMYAPVNASASAGDLIKMSGLSSVYYLGSDGKRYVFPNEATYMSWYSDFNGVVTIPASELQSYPLGGNVVMRAGTKLVKITTDPSVYAVEPNGVLRKIQSEAQAAALYGTNWNKRVVDVSDAFFTNYTIGAVLANGVIPAGSLVKNAGGAEVFYFDGTNYRSIANEAAFNANRFAWGNIITASSTVTAGGTALSSGEFVNVAQNGGTGVIITGSGLMVSLNSSTPASISVPQNGARVPMAKINLTAANDGAVSVNSILVKRIGLTSYSDVNQVWMEKDGMIVASKKTVNSNDESILTFSPALVVNAGATVTLDLVASLKGSGGNMGFSIASASAVSSTGATVSGSFPINGNLMSLTSYNVVNVSIATTTSATQTVKVGDEKVELGSFELGFSGTAKDVSISSIMLKNNGVEDLSKTVMNLYLEQAGNKVSTGVTVNGRYVTFTFGSGLNLLKDDSSKVFKIKGDIIGKENATDPAYTFTLNKSTDLVAYEKSTGFGANVVAPAVSGTSADNFAISKVNITSGAISVSKKSTSPSDTTIVKGSDSIVLLANLKTDEAMNADGLNINYSSTGSASLTTDQFENVRVYVNGVLLDSFDPATSTGVAMKSIDSNLSLNKGDNEIKVMAKAKTNATNNSAFIAKFVTGTGADAIFNGKNPTYVSSGNAIAAGSIGGSATGGTFTVAGAAITVTRNDGYADGKSIVKGSNDVSLGKFTLKAVNDALTITSISLAGNTSASTTDVSDSSIFDAKVYVDGVQVGNTVDFASSGANFSSLNFSIAKDATKNVEIKASFDSSAAGGFLTEMTVNSQDSRGKEITTNNTASTIDFAVTDQGSLNVAVGGNTPAAGILVAKAAEQEVAQIKFTAVNDSASLTEINVVNWDGSATSSAADPRIAAIKLYDGSNLLDSFVPVAGVGKFTISNDAALIAANNSKTLSIKVSLNPIDNDGLATDKDLAIRVVSVKSKSSAGSVTTLNSTTTGNSFRIRKTVPTVALAALPSTLLTAGNTVVSKFTVSADSNGDVALGKIVLTYATSSDVVLDETALVNGVKVNGVTKAASSTVSIANKTITIDFKQSAEEIVTAGTTKTIEIIANVLSVGNNSQSLTTKIVEPADYSAGASFEWSDGASITAATYSNGRRVPGLSTDTQVLSKN